MGSVTSVSLVISYSALVKTLSRVLLVVCVAVSLQAQNVDPQTFATNLRAGESINGFPNWAERVILEWMNRARVDPQKEMTACGAACSEAICYKPAAPLVRIKSRRLSFFIRVPSSP